MRRGCLRQAHHRLFAGRCDDIAAVYLFGSTASGNSRSDSDVDVAVLVDPPPARVLNDAPVDLSIRVLRHGRLLSDAKPAVRIAFEVRTRNEAFDLEPMLMRYRAGRTVGP